MKKHFLLALAGAALLVSAPQAFAGTAASISTDGSGAGADVFTVSGNIPEYIQFSGVDNKLELGNLGGPTASGLISTTTRAQQANNTAGGFSKGTTNPTGYTVVGDDGTAQVQLTANTYVRVTSTLPTVLTNTTGTTAPNTPATFTLPIKFRYAVKGLVKFNDTTTYAALPSSNNNVDPQGYATFSPEVAVIDATFAPFAGSALTPSGEAPSGFKVAGFVSRNGLNDLRGDYSAQINLDYSKF